MNENVTQQNRISSKITSAADNVEAEVLRRYREGAQQVEVGLCCPTQYDSRFVELLPLEIVEKDYGCGDPSYYVHEGETVVDLGSGAGKICYILAQKVGPEGSVIGVDFNDDMLALARKYLSYMEGVFGYRNVRFVKAKIQDMALDLELAQQWLDAHPIGSIEQLGAFEAECERLRREHPPIPASSVDVVVSNCVLNLVRPRDKRRLFAQIHRVLKLDGRAVISDIVCDEDPTPSILADPDLWSGCISGAFREDRFLEMFENAGFYGIEILARQAEPWQVIDGIKFRSITVRAFKGKEGPRVERNQAVIFKGARKSVCDADGIAAVPPHEEVPFNEAEPFDCKDAALRHPRQTKKDRHSIATNQHASCCDPEDCC